MKECKNKFSDKVIIRKEVLSSFEIPQTGEMRSKYEGIKQIKLELKPDETLEDAVKRKNIVKNTIREVYREINLEGTKEFVKILSPFLDE